MILNLSKLKKSHIIHKLLSGARFTQQYQEMQANDSLIYCLSPGVTVDLLRDSTGFNGLRVSNSLVDQLRRIVAQFISKNYSLDQLENATVLLEHASSYVHPLSTRASSSLLFSADNIVMDNVTRLSRNLSDWHDVRQLIQTKTVLANCYTYGDLRRVVLNDDTTKYNIPTTTVDEQLLEKFMLDASDRGFYRRRAPFWSGLIATSKDGNSAVQALLKECKRSIDQVMSSAQLRHIQAIGRISLDDMDSDSDSESDSESDYESNEGENGDHDSSDEKVTVDGESGSDTTEPTTDAPGSSDDGHTNSSFKVESSDSEKDNSPVDDGGARLRDEYEEEEFPLCPVEELLQKTTQSSLVTQLKLLSLVAPVTDHRSLTARAVRKSTTSGIIRDIILSSPENTLFLFAAQDRLVREHAEVNGVLDALKLKKSKAISMTWNTRAFASDPESLIASYDAAYSSYSSALLAQQVAHASQITTRSLPILLPIQLGHGRELEARALRHSEAFRSAQSYSMRNSGRRADILEELCSNDEIHNVDEKTLFAEKSSGLYDNLHWLRSPDATSCLCIRPHSKDCRCTCTKCALLSLETPTHPSHPSSCICGTINCPNSQSCAVKHCTQKAVANDLCNLHLKAHLQHFLDNDPSLPLCLYRYGTTGQRCQSLARADGHGKGYCLQHKFGFLQKVNEVRVLDELNQLRRELLNKCDELEDLPSQLFKSKEEEECTKLQLLMDGPHIDTTAALSNKLNNLKNMIASPHLLPKDEDVLSSLTVSSDADAALRNLKKLLPEIPSNWQLHGVISKALKAQLLVIFEKYGIRTREDTSAFTSLQTNDVQRWLAHYGAKLVGHPVFDVPCFQLSVNDSIVALNYLMRNSSSIPIADLDVMPESVVLMEGGLRRRKRLPELQQQIQNHLHSLLCERGLASPSKRLPPGFDSNPRKWLNDRNLTLVGYPAHVGGFITLGMEDATRIVNDISQLAIVDGINTDPKHDVQKLKGFERDDVANNPIAQVYLNTMKTGGAAKVKSGVSRLLLLQNLGLVSFRPRKNRRARLQAICRAIMQLKYITFMASIGRFRVKLPGNLCQDPVSALNAHDRGHVGLKTISWSEVIPRSDINDWTEEEALSVAYELFTNPRAVEFGVMGDDDEELRSRIKVTYAHRADRPVDSQVIAVFENIKLENGKGLAAHDEQTIASKWEFLSRVWKDDDGRRLTLEELLQIFINTITHLYTIGRQKHHLTNIVRVPSDFYRHPNHALNRVGIKPTSLFVKTWPETFPRRYPGSWKIGDMINAVYHLTSQPNRIQFLTEDECDGDIPSIDPLEEEPADTHYRHTMKSHILDKETGQEKPKFNANIWRYDSIPDNDAPHLRTMRDKVDYIESFDFEKITSFDHMCRDLLRQIILDRYNQARIREGFPPSPLVGPVLDQPTRPLSTPRNGGKIFIKTFSRVFLKTKLQSNNKIEPIINTLCLLLQRPRLLTFAVGAEPQIDYAFDELGVDLGLEDQFAVKTRELFSPNLWRIVEYDRAQVPADLTTHEQRKGFVDSTFFQELSEAPERYTLCKLLRECFLYKINWARIRLRELDWMSKFNNDFLHDPQSFLAEESLRLESWSAVLLDDREIHSWDLASAYLALCCFTKYFDDLHIGLVDPTNEDTPFDEVARDLVKSIEGVATDSEADGTEVEDVGSPSEASGDIGLPQYVFDQDSDDAPRHLCDSSSDESSPDKYATGSSSEDSSSDWEHDPVDSDMEVDIEDLNAYNDDLDNALTSGYVMDSSRKRRRRA